MWWLMWLYWTDGDSCDGDYQCDYQCDDWFDAEDDESMMIIMINDQCHEKEDSFNYIIMNHQCCDVITKDLAYA